MKRFQAIVLSLVSMVLMDEVDAREGGGGMRGGGESRRPETDYNRSNERPANRDDSAREREDNAAREERNRANFNDRNHQDMKNAVQQFQQRRDDNSGITQLPAGAISPTKEASQTSAQNASQVKQNHPGYGSWFNSQFFDNHGMRPFYDSPGADWYRAATWAGAAGWLGWGNAAAAPVYYDTSGNPVTVQAPNANTNQTAQTPNGSSSTEVASADVSNTTWMPLGIFAVGTEKVDVGNTNAFLQLALNKNGEISGTYYNSKEDKTQQVGGFVDPKSQQASWKLSNDPNSPIMSTGLYNLTQDSTTAQVNFSDSTVQTWNLLRIKK